MKNSPLYIDHQDNKTLRTYTPIEIGKANALDILRLGLRQTGSQSSTSKILPAKFTLLPAPYVYW
ncbi:hypothetical protein [Thermoflexibacter ruber]|uniref:hypothetical protein n=1 Tax=Thermoflexibacter ruber TaxID=1003 RepID=UPI001160AD1B|nr:hypothetical protein [Thermoflexibacter ruber]